MAFTVTVTQGGSTQAGMALSVIVLTGATEAGGASLQNQLIPGAPQGTVTPNFTGSLIYWAIANGTTDVTGWTLNGSNSFGGTGCGDYNDTTDIYRAATGAYTGTVTATVGVTVGASAPTADDTAIAAYEIPKSGTIAVDASTPAQKTGTATSQASNSFTPPAGAVLVALVANNGTGSGLQTVAISDTSGLGLTWTRRAISNTSGNSDSLAAIWTATMPAPAAAPAVSQPQYLPGWFPGAPGLPGGEPFTPWPQAQPGGPVTPGAPPPALVPGSYDAIPGIAIPALFVPGRPSPPLAPLPVAPAPLQVPAWFPSAPSAPGQEPFTAWPQYLPATLAPAGLDVLNAAAVVTATAAASLTVTKAAWQLPPQYPPAWFPSAPSAPGGDPFVPWPLGQTGVNSFSLNAALTVTATAAAALTEAKPLNAASTITATGAAALTEAKPLNAAQTVTVTAVAALTVVKAGVTPAPDYPPAWFPSAPGAPGGQPFTAWPAWEGTSGGVSTPVDLLNAASVITATVTASLTTAKPLNAAATVTASRAAAETTAKPLNAASTITASQAASLSDVHAPVVPAPPQPALYAPSWFPGSPGTPAQEPFAPWPPWTGATAAAAVTAPGTLTAADTAASLTATAGGSALTAAAAAGGTLTAVTAAGTTGAYDRDAIPGRARPARLEPGRPVTGPPGSGVLTGSDKRAGGPS